MNPEKSITLCTLGLDAGYGKGIILSDVTLEVRPGEILTLIGPNGAGKSTLLKTIAGQLAPMGGTILLDGKALEEYSGNALAKKLSILMTGQLRSELMTCRDVVETGRYPYTGRLGLLTEEDRKCVSEAMGLTGVLDLGERQFSHISDGQRQLVLLARAICQEPKVLILDEPTSYLDIRHKLELMHVLRELARKKQIAVIQSLHELELAQKCADFLLCIRNGVVDRMGTPEEIFSGDYISRLYGLQNVGFSNTFASAELPAPEGDAQVFVIGGGGMGIPMYRRLQRQGIPFAAGILWKSDLDYPIAAALGSEILSLPFGGIPSEEILQQAKEMIDRTAYTLCTLSQEQLQGTAESLRELKAYAAHRGKLRTEVESYGL